MMTRADRPAMDPFPDLVNRTAECSALEKAMATAGESHRFVYGPKGAGKTLVARHALRNTSDQLTTAYLTCMDYDTQYKLLASLVDRLTETNPGPGYHTAQLANRVRDAVRDEEMVLVFDDIDFLLLNDGDDLLYFLSRLDQASKLQLVLISSACPDLSMELDERVYSSLLPKTRYFEPYPPSETERILARWAGASVDQPVTSDAIARVAASTANIALGSHWLRAATEQTETEITADDVRAARTAAINRYRSALLDPFSVHHRLLFDSIELLTAESASVHSGQVYEWYRTLCRKRRHDPVSTRRLSDFLKHLEILDLIRVEYHYGGKEGKTRRIWLQEPVENLNSR